MMKDDEGPWAVRGTLRWMSMANRASIPKVVATWKSKAGRCGLKLEAGTTDRMEGVIGRPNQKRPSVESRGLRDGESR